MSVPLKIADLRLYQQYNIAGVQMHIGEMPLKIAIVTGSTRPGRNNEAVANWVYRIAKERKDAEFELVDIASFNLPLLDEPLPPLFSQYSHEHTKAWSIIGAEQLPRHARIPGRSGSGVCGARVS